MARGIAFALGDGIGSLVKGFCASNPMPPIPLSVSPIDVTEGDLTFADLLKAIIKTKATDLLLVPHGILGGSGVALPIAKGTPWATGKRLELLMQAASGKSLTDRQAAEFGSDHKKVIPELVDLMEKVRAMNLNTVEWRSCDLGKDPGVLKQFRDFFGANLMGAPVMDNNFGNAVTNIRPINKIPERFWKEFKHYDYPDKVHTKVTYFLKLDEKGDPSEGAIFAESKDDLKDWIQKNINPKGTVPQNGSIFMHHLWKEADKDHPLDPGTPILPLEAEYKDNITYVRG